MNNILILINTVFNIIKFLNLPQINLLPNRLFVLDSFIFIAFVVIFAIIVLEIVLCYFYQVEFYISIQWKIYRFIILPFLFSLLISEIETPKLLGVSATMTIFVSIVIISLIFTALFSIESYVFNKLLHRDFSINWYTLII